MKRYDVHIERVVLGTGISYAKTVAHENPTGDYAMYEEANARIAELTAEVARLRDACRIAECEFSYLTSQHRQFDRQDRIRWESLGDIARNALKEGV